jgi:hypothetical protein
MREKASPVAIRASKLRLKIAAAAALSIAIKSFGWRLRPDAEKFAGRRRSVRESGIVDQY